MVHANAPSAMDLDCGHQMTSWRSFGNETSKINANIQCILLAWHVLPPVRLLASVTHGFGLHPQTDLEAGPVKVAPQT